VGRSFERAFRANGIRWPRGLLTARRRPRDFAPCLAQRLTRAERPSERSQVLFADNTGTLWDADG
jgi:hypothetical protein